MKESTSKSPRGSRVCGLGLLDVRFAKLKAQRPSFYLRHAGDESEKVVPAAGVEPATFRSGGERSNPLSYAGMSPFRMNH